MALRREDYGYAVNKFGPALSEFYRRKPYCNKQDAEDLVQRAFLIAWKKRDTYEGSKPEDIKKWLWGIAKKEYWSWRRKTGRTIRIVEALKAEFGLNTPIGIREESEIIVGISQFLGKLESPEDLIVGLYYGHPIGSSDGSPIEPHSDAEIAEVLNERGVPSRAKGGWTAGAVKMRRHRVFKWMRERLVDYRKDEKSASAGV